MTEGNHPANHPPRRLVLFRSAAVPFLPAVSLHIYGGFAEHVGDLV
ncbi:hypothetical protein [Parvularcula dongshanensis]|uniref:Uncharacterized protein n=1 Tax=Parvularcula dongshanensis TaxID=1173995 RepID=A0A840I4I7_9PROT|nr:hypothetical protein [Parvularcula dongshanensis]MBB4659697.1 hypothetical protein [Parvularcula dongshanensis]